MKIDIFPSPRAQEEARAWNFSKFQCPYKGGAFGIFPSPRDYMKAVLRIFLSQDPYRYGRAKSNILTYFLIFLHIFVIFLHIFHIFFHIFDVFLHIFQIFLHIFGLFLLILTLFPSYSFIFSTSFFIFFIYSFIFRSYLLHQGIPKCDGH